MNNPFQSPAFSMTALTAAINILPNQFGKIEQINLMPAKPVRFRQIAIEERNGVLNLLPTLPVGAPGTVGQRSRRKLRSFMIPHIPHDDVVLPEEIQGLRAFGSETDTETVANVMTDHLQSMRNKHAITLEHLRMGALKGVILDADGSVLYDLFEEFQITPAVFNFELNKKDTDVKKKCLDLKRYFELNLKGEYMTNVRVLVSSDFFDALTSHPNVIRAYQLTQESAMLRADQRSGFTFAGVTFEEYLGQATDMAGNLRRFIEPGEGQAFPEGTLDTFATYFAPADFNETVNTLGQPLYAKQEPRDFGRGTDLHTQSNPLPMCHRPSLLVKVLAS
jgi:hypothetical protein